MKNKMHSSELKEWHRRVRDEFPADLNLRLHRSLSWLNRAELASDDDVAFILYWISFNAAYSKDFEDSPRTGTRTELNQFFEKLVELDAEKTIHHTVLDTFRSSIVNLLTNRYAFAPFWAHHNDQPGYEDWAKRFKKSAYVVRNSIESHDTTTVLSILFDRLYVLRNQLVHGGATWNSSVNRKQVETGVQVLSALLPRFLELMLSNPEVDWGKPFFPVVD